MRDSVVVAGIIVPGRRAATAHPHLSQSTVARDGYPTLRSPHLMEAGTGISITLFRSRSEEILEHSIETSIPFLPSLLETCHRFPLLVLLLLVFAHTAGPTGTSHPNPNPNPNPKFFLASHLSLHYEV